MSERQPTPEQLAAIEAGGRRVLLEAGAGTGKTGVMVDRYCRLVCEEKVAPEAILAITFTEKAAAELRERIRAQLARRAAAGEARAGELLAEIGGAWITTIHGFCHRVIAAHPVAAGVDPRFSVLDAAEADRAAREAFDEALAEFLAGGEEDREETVAAYGIESLRGMVVSAHGELRSRGARRPRLPQAPPSNPGPALRRAAEAARETLAELGESDRNRELVERAVEALGAAVDGNADLDALASLRTSSRAKAMGEYRAAVDAAIARVAEAGEGGTAYRHAGLLLDAFSQRFEAAKERRRGLDFEDLQLLAADLLDQDELGRTYRTRFSHLMIDEFQDTNRLQLKLVESLRGPSTSLVVVGDLLQSIYGFRHADLDVFREQRAAIEADPHGEALELSGNFRSRPELIGSVNLLGSTLIGEAYRLLTVGVAPAAPAPGEGPPVELLLTPKGGWEELDLEPAVDSGTPPHYLAEARALALRLRELVDQGVRRGDVVVLLRAFTHLDAFEDALARMGLRPYVVGGRGYWSQQQVADVCALLASVANPLDDEALLGSLASPACAVGPDTLWLLRAASGRSRALWPAVERAAGVGEAELEEPERLEQIEAGDVELLRRFVAAVGELRELGTRLPLAELIDRAVTITGYDLAVLAKPSGEARFANVRKLMQIAADYEAREGRDLRGLLDFLAFRGAADDESEAATAAEDHDGVRIMSVHRAKGLEFDVVAVPHLDRRLLAGSWPPLLTFGRDEDHRVGIQLRRLGARSLNLYAHEELREEVNDRDVEEGLRLFHVAATRARQRLILSGVVREKPTDTSVLERIVVAFEIDREADSQVEVPAPTARPGLDLGFEPSRIAVRVNRPGTEQAARLVERRPAPGLKAAAGEGPAPLLDRRPPIVPARPLSYTAIAAYEECPYRFYLERVLGLPPRGRASSRIAQPSSAALEGDDGAVAGLPSAREERSARGAAVHALLEWSHGNGWAEPDAELARRHALAAGLDPGGDAEALLGPVREWLGSELLRERIAAAARVRAEVPLLLGVGGNVLRGSIDLLAESDGAPPLVVDYKTDRLGGADPAQRAEKYEVQRSVYALASAEALGCERVEVAYVFLERPEQPVLTELGPAELEAGRERLTAAVARIAAGEFPVAESEERDWDLCRGCPALGTLCSGPPQAESD